MSKPIPLEELKNRTTLTVCEAAAVLGLSRAQTYKEVKAGNIEVARYGRRIAVLAVPLYRKLLGTSVEA